MVTNDVCDDLTDVIVIKNKKSLHVNYNVEQLFHLQIAMLQAYGTFCCVPQNNDIPTL